MPLALEAGERSTVRLLNVGLVGGSGPDCSGVDGGHRSNPSCSKAALSNVCTPSALAGFASAGSYGHRNSEARDGLLRENSYDRRNSLDNVSYSS
jgi:hypothetical protein